MTNLRKLKVEKLLAIVEIRYRRIGYQNLSKQNKVQAIKKTIGQETTRRQ